MTVKPTFYKTLLSVLCVLWVACDTEKPRSKPFPRQAVFAALDQTPDEATTRIQALYPGARLHRGALLRVMTPNQTYVDEFILFRNVRSGRINAVIVKFRQELDQAQLKDVLRATGVESFANLGHPKAKIEVVYQGLLWRARERDKQGRLTVTVEAQGLAKSADKKQPKDDDKRHQ